MISSPISANSVVDVDIDFKCLDVTCKTLPNTLQAIVDKVCESPDFESLEFGDCVQPGTTLLEVLTNIMAAITCSEGDVVTPEPEEAIIEGLTTCSTDSWNCASTDACLTFTNECSPGDTTLLVVLQTLINRIVAMGNVIKSQCTQISTLQSQMAVVQAQIVSIQATCCA